jgi:hypothetical protein
MSKLTLNEALNAVSSGHSWWKVSYAKAVCKAFGYELPERLIETYHSQQEANPGNYFKGLFINTYKWPVSGVSATNLSDFIAKKVLGYCPSGGFLGRGSGSQANAEEIRKKT